MNHSTQCFIAVVVLASSVAPHSACAHGKVIKALAPDHAAHIISPDHQFVADFIIDAGTTGVLSVSGLGKGKVHLPSPLKDLAQVDSFMWLPRHPHTLVFSTSGVNSRSTLMLFDGKSLHVLRQTEKIQSGSFLLHGCQTDGRTLVYGYSPHSFSLHDQTLRHAEGELQKRRYFLIDK